VTDAYDVRFRDKQMRQLARQVGATMTLPSERGPESVDPRIRLRAALDDNTHLKQRLIEVVREKEELRVLLRTALWELARANGSNNPKTWSAKWYRERKSLL
jgi:hypothetical protein